MPSKWTVQELIDRRMKLHAYCHRSTCHHNKLVDLELLKAKLGPDARAMNDDLLPKLKCAKCGGREIGLTYSPHTSPMTSFGSPYAPKMIHD
jgi:hypothetical protein